MNCSKCGEPFNLSDRLPFNLCVSEHTACAQCAESLKSCPLCSSNSAIDRATGTTSPATPRGNRYPKISSDQIDLLDLIYEGESCDLYTAECFKLPVAVKMVPLTNKARLLAEMKTLLRLTHPAVLRVYGLSFWEDRIGIVMERASSSLSIPNSLSYRTVEYAKQICHAVNFLHSKFVVHGDLNPENVLVVDQEVRIAVFEISTVSRSDLMTLRYTAPEVLENSFTPQSDVYSLGILLYELFRNKHAFEGMPVPSIVEAKRREISLPFDGTIPDELFDVISRCLSADPAQRPELSVIIEILQNLNLPKEQILPETINQLHTENTSLKNPLEISQNQSQTSDFSLENVPQTSTNISSSAPSSSTRNVLGNSQHSSNFNEDQRMLQLRMGELLKEMGSGNTPSVVLSHKHIGDDGATYLAEALMANATVTNVDLSHNNIGNYGVTSLAEALIVNATVTNVNLSHNNIGDDGVKALAEALKTNATVTSVNLSHNNIGDDGAKALSEALKVNATIRTVNLNSNFIGNEGVEALSKALTVNSKIIIYHLGVSRHQFRTMSPLRCLLNVFILGFFFCLLCAIFLMFF
ncbi:hypothetical protein GEMRC1_011109 [Eukaryota sp. GEM-RC1]